MQMTLLKKNLQRVALVAVCCLPTLALAADGNGSGFLQILQQYASNIRLGMYALAGTLAMGSLLWSGIMWMKSRVGADRSHGFMDYLSDAVVVMVVGGALAFAAAMWQIFGTGAPT